MSDTDLQLYGVDHIVRAENENVQDDQRPIMDSLSTHIISDRCRQQLDSEVSSTWISTNFGMDVYLTVRDIISSHLDVYAHD